MCETSLTLKNVHGVFKRNDHVFKKVLKAHIRKKMYITYFRYSTSISEMFENVHKNVHYILYKTRMFWRKNSRWKLTKKQIKPQIKKKGCSEKQERNNEKERKPKTKKKPKKDKEKRKEKPKWKPRKK